MEVLYTCIAMLCVHCAGMLIYSFIVILTKHIHCPKRNLTQQGKKAVYSLNWIDLFVTKKLSLMPSN